MNLPKEEVGGGGFFRFEKEKYLYIVEEVLVSGLGQGLVVEGGQNLVA